MRVLVNDIGAVIHSLRTGEFDEDFSDDFSGGTAPYYIYGHPLEVATRLLQKDKNKAEPKYPLFILVLDFPEKNNNGEIKYTLNIVIVASTKKERRAPERYSEVIIPVLYPLYEQFFTALKRSGLFRWQAGTGGMDAPPHTKIDRPFYGYTGLNSNEKYIFNDPLDAIEITGLEIFSTQKKCK